jgi:serine/threonine protein kinase
VWFSTAKKAKAVFEHELDAFAQGKIECPSCHHVFPMAGHTPLSVEPCPRCENPILVPLKQGNYWLFKLLGKGGMGEVYKAWRVDNRETPFAVKILPQHKRDSLGLRKNLLDEAEVGKRLGGHDNILTVIEFGEINGEYYVVSEYLAGTLLGDALSTGVKMPDDEVFSIGMQILAAESHIHNQGYLYRDLKPSNIMLHPQRGAVLFDFGICLTLEDAKWVKLDEFQGTPAYMPPERIVGVGEQVNSEIYSLGMVLFHAAAGCPLFEPGSGEAAMQRVIRAHLGYTREGPRMRRIQGKTLLACIKRMIHRDTYKRFNTFAEAEEMMMILYLRGVCPGAVVGVKPGILELDNKKNPDMAGDAAAENMLADILVSCNRCGRVLAIAAPEIGQEMVCPACDHNFIVPSRSKAAKQENVSLPMACEISDEERAQLAAVDEELLAFLDGATNKNCWEHGLAAALMQRVLDPLLQKISARWGPFNVVETKWFQAKAVRKAGEGIDQGFEAVMKAKLSLYRIINETLDQALYHNRIADLVGFQEKLKAWGDMLLQANDLIYRLEIPSHQACSRLLELLVEWIGSDIAVLNGLADHLAQVHHEGGTKINVFEHQISLVPPHLTEYSSERMKLYV